MTNAAALLTRRKVVQVSTETTKGTLVAGATHVLVYDPVMQLNDSTQSRQPSGSALGNFPAVSGERVGTFNCKAEMRGDGSGGFDIGLEMLLIACGFSQSSEIITPVSSVSTMKTVTEREGKIKELKKTRKMELEDKVIKYNLHPISLGFFG